MLRVFIVDDESPARAELAFLLQQYEDIKIIGEATSGEEALEKIPSAEPDVIFMDIHLHDLDGVDVAQQIVSIMETPPVIIFASAYEIHAVRAFETEATDYIVKPISEHRLEKTVNRLRKSVSRTHAQQVKTEPEELEQRITALVQTVLSEQQPKRIPVEKNGKILLIDPNEIVFAKVESRYAMIHTAIEQYSTSFSLQELELRLPYQQFYRTHRAFIVNISKIAELVPWFKGSLHLIMQDQLRSEIPVGRSAVKEVKRRLGF